MGQPTPPPPFSVSDRALARVQGILAAEAKPGLQLRVSVSGGGCSGFQYNFDLDDEHQPDDVAVERDGVRVVVDGMSLMYLIGAELDYVEDLTGAYFRVHNPNASSSCGCGSSFAI
jgi:iron-sulfur cluster insertion protein